jgi:hypothetical protein
MHSSREWLYNLPENCRMPEKVCCHRIASSCPMVHHQPQQAQLREGSRCKIDALLLNSSVWQNTSKLELGGHGIMVT